MLSYQRKYSIRRWFVDDLVGDDTHNDEEYAYVQHLLRRETQGLLGWQIREAAAARRLWPEADAWLPR